MKKRILQMKAPDGYHLCNITATTYDLDLAVLRQLTGKYPCVSMTILCDGTMITDTENETVDLSGYEDIIVPIELPFARFKIGDEPVRYAFHPKLWILAYRNETGERFYRLSIGSCNITLHDNLEAEFCAEGYVTKETENRNIDIISFLNEVGAYARGANSCGPISEELLTDLEHIEFRPLADVPIDDFEILFTGALYPGWFNSLKDKLKVMLNSYDELLILSPGLSDKVMKDINNSLAETGGSCTILTYKRDYDRLSAELRQTLSDRLHFVFQQDYVHRLHAKMYISRKGSSFRVYLGSRNATEVARIRTVEAMAYLSIESSEKSICEIAECFLVRYNNTRG